MGMLVDGQWDKDATWNTDHGKFKRDESKFRQFIKKDGSTPFMPEKDRYHLYISLACPWAHRTLIFRKLKGLENIIGLSIVDPYMGENGWEFTAQNPDHLFGFKHLHQVYTKADPHYTGRVTVPVLWDKKDNTIVSNESAEIIRMLNSEFDELTDNHLDYYPENLHKEIDEINDFVYHNINNGVYKCGFATEQQAYDEAYINLFNALDKIEQRLSKQQYLVDDSVTEADWRLFTTLVRFDPVYYSHFKCNKKRLIDYPHIWQYLRKLYNMPGIADTVDMRHIKEHYHRSHVHINPTQIVPKGPEIDFS